MSLVSTLSYLENFITSTPILLKTWYNMLSVIDRSADLTFINFGYQNKKLNHPEVPKYLQNQLHMYLQTIQGVSLKNKSVVEVSSGRGGGAYYLTRNFSPKSYIGIDFSNQAIKFCKQYYHLPHLSFMVGNAEAIPLPDKSIDVLINIESAQLYQHITIFFDEAHRILRPQGHFLLSFNYPQQKIPYIRKYLQHKGFKIIKAQNITSHVLHSMEQDESLKMKLVDQKVPFFLRKGFKAFIGIKGSSSYQLMKTGKVQYWTFQMQKIF